jgi:CO dehydrogenase maturation factor
MRVGFLGKGGSGKTTIAAAYIRWSAKKRFVLAIDADVNVHLSDALSMEAPEPIGHDFEKIAEYVRGTRSDLNETKIVATTPPSTKSRFVRPTPDDQFIKNTCSQLGNIRLLSIGTYRSEDVGHTCYHGKLNVLELLYHHLLDDNEDLVVADTTAGIDNLGTSLYFCYDVNFFVVEPTLKSIKVYHEFAKEAKHRGLDVHVIINKVRTEADREFVRSHVPEASIVAWINHSEAAAKIEQGDDIAWEPFLHENERQLRYIDELVFSHKKDWKIYYERLLVTHKVNSEEWWNEYYDQNISEQQDREFSYDDVLRGAQK